MGTPIQEPELDLSGDIRHIIDFGLASRNAIFGDSGAKAWRASSLGYCLRRQMFERAGVPKPRRDDGSRTLWLGDIIHRAVQQMIYNSGLLLAEEITLLDEELHLSGHVDLVWGGMIQDWDYDDLVETHSMYWADFITNYRKALIEHYGKDTFFKVTLTEFKSANQYSAEKAYTDGVSFHHGIQAGAYRLMAERNPSVFPEVVRRNRGIDQYQVVMLAKSDLKMPVFDIFPSAAERALERVSLLNQAWAEQVIPPCTCGQEISWEARYCAYRHPDDAGSRNPRCCMPELIEQADPSFWAEVLTEEIDEEAQRLADEQEVLPREE
jgi:hypothetical protein